MKTRLFKIAKALGLFALSRRLTQGGLRILCYHGIWLGEGHYGNFLFMSPEKFAARMAFLARAGYPLLPLGEAVERLRAGSLPAGATAITIDDGWHGTYRHMLPALEAHRLPATVYVTTYCAEKQYPVFDLVVRYLLDRGAGQELDLAALGIAGAGRVRLDTPEARGAAGEAIMAHGREALDGAGCHAFGARLAAALGFDYDALVARRIFHLMSPAELADAVERGFDIQLHTHRHRTPLDDPEALAREIADNRARLEPIAKRRLHHFCYPSGVYERKIWPQLEALEIESATTIEQGINFADAPVLGLKRLLDGQDVELIEFEAELCGFIELTRRLRRPFRRSVGGTTAAEHAAG
ncbi:polysaccharide deacetylase family protein [Pelagibius sp. 7325]|uniref:polysaccharide deacetylase family protein n=1 Tax=Pelagibius sp. 7325 TaxID=3131994 RepID=UPI0030EBC07A